MIHQFITDEKFTNIQQAQAGLTRLFQQAKKSLSFYRVMKNDEPLGVLVPENIWQNIMEDIEALTSSTFKRKIARARKDKKRISAKDVKRKLGL